MLTRLLLTISLFLPFAQATTGVNFVPHNEFYSTYSMWAISFTIDLRPYYSNIDHINRTAMTLRPTVSNEIDRSISNLNRSRQNNTNIPPEIESDLTLLKINLAQQISVTELQATAAIFRVNQILKDLRELYTQDNDFRSKRSLLPWAGDLLGSLFGTATKADMAQLRNQINSIASNKNELVHVVQNSLTIVNKTNNIVANNRRSLNLLTAANNKLDKKMRILHNTLIDRTRIQDIKLQMTSKVFGMTNAISRTLRKLTNMVNQLATNMDNALRNQLSTTLITPGHLRDVLHGISKRIPNSLTLKRYDGNSIAWYYKHLPITVIPGQSKIHLVSVIPLIPVESLYTLYRVVVLPIPIASKQLASEVVVEGTHFAVSRQGNSYVVLDEDELLKCQTTDTTYCPLNRAAMNLARMPSCLGSLYLTDQDGITKNCPVKITNNYNFPIFRHLVKGKWMVATDKPVNIHQKCDTLGGISTPISVTDPVQVITLTSGCTGYTEYAKLSPYFYKSSSDPADLIEYQKLNVGSELIPIWNLKSSNYTYDYQLINAKPSLSQLPEFENVDMGALLSQLDNIDKNNIIMSNSPVWKVITITVGCTLVAMFLVLAGIYLFKLKINTKRKYSISHPIPKREPKNNDLELGTFSGPGRGLSTSRGSSLNADPELTTALRSTTIENEL